MKIIDSNFVRFSGPRCLFTHNEMLFLERSPWIIVSDPRPPINVFVWMHGGFLAAKSTRSSPAFMKKILSNYL